MDKVEHEDVVAGDASPNMLEKGHNMISDTIHTINDNVRKINKNLSKRQGGLFQLPSLSALMPTNPENPIMKLKETFFPTKTAAEPETVKQLAEKKNMKSQPSEFESNFFTEDFFADKLAKDHWQEQGSQTMASADFDDEYKPFLYSE